MLRQLAQYHAKDPNNLFMVRLAQVGGKTKGTLYKTQINFWKSVWVCVCVCVYVHALRVCVRVIIDFLPCLPLQGLTHLGKGTLTLCPYHSDRQLMSQVAVAGLLTVLVSFLDVKNSEFIFSHSAAHIHY